MLAYFWLPLLLIKVSGICYEECKSSDAFSCSRCLSINALDDSNSQSHLICNLWDSPECWMGWYNIKVDHEAIKIGFPSDQKEIYIKFSQETKSLSAEFWIHDKEKLKESDELSCLSSYFPDGWQSLGLLLKPRETENPLLIWLIGSFSENQNSFKGFIYIEIAIENFPSEISCVEIPDQAKNDCKNCEKSCAPWLLHDACAHKKRNLACGPYTYNSAITMDQCPTGITADSSCNCQIPGSEVFNIVLKNIEDPVTDSMNSIKVAVGSTGGTFYPTYDTYDPYPSEGRGYYFAGSKYMQLPPNNLDSGNSINFAPDFAISVWIYTHSSTSGNILVKKSSSSTSTYYLYYGLSGNTPYLTLNIGSSNNVEAKSGATAIGTSQWYNIGASVSYTVSVQSDVYFYINGAQVSTGIYSDYFNDNYSGYKIWIGADYDSSFSPTNSLIDTFIYSLRIWNTNADLTSYDYLTSGCTSSCGYCPPDGACLAAYGIDKYYDSGTSSWLTCDSACTSKGCVRNDKNCNLCATQYCKTCDNWSSCIDCISNANSATAPCTSCGTGYLWDTTNEVCSGCIFYCTACGSGTYLIAGGVCSSFCPLGYTANSGTNICDANTSTVALNLVISSLSGVITESANSLNVITGTSSTFYPGYETNDPKAAYKRGYYFDGSASLMHLAPYSSYTTPLLTLAPELTIQAWVNPSSDGTLISKVDSSFANIFTFSIVSSKPTIYINMKTNGQKTFTCENTITTSSWNHIGISMQLVSSGQNTELVCTVNGISDTASTDFGVDYFMDTASGFYSTIAALQTASSSYSTYYTGFIYKILIDNSYSSATSDYQTTSCSGGCSTCPAASSTCLIACPIGEYWTSSNYNSCSSCHSNCLAKGCRDDGPICNLCDDIICSVCSDYSAVCTTCLSNAALVSSQCTCNDSYYWDSTNQVCTPCQSSCATCDGGTSSDCLSCTGSYYLNGVCYTTCPNGYTGSGTSCVSSVSLILAYTFDKIQDTITDSAQSIVALTGNSNSFYPSYGTYDPLAAYDRGYYFSGSTYIQLPPYSGSATAQLYIGTDNTFCTWIWPTAPAGTIFSKQKNSASVDSYYTITLSGYYPMITLNVYKSGSGGSTITGSYVCPSAITNDRWYYIVIQTTYSSSAKKTYANCYIDSSTVSSSQFVAAGSLRDSQTNYLNDIGAAHTDQSTFGNFIRAFIYSIKLWKTIVSNPTTVDRLTSCTGQAGCTQCPGSATCLSLCTLSQYWDTTSSSCKSCHTNCYTKGCVRYDKSCNLCASQICYKCTDFTSCPTALDSCITNASPSPCACDSGYYFSTTKEECTKCPTGCAQCTDATHIGCSSCLTGYYKLSGLCRNYCPLGYSISGQTCSPNSPTLFFDLQLTKIQGVVYDSQSSIPAVTGTSSAFYPSFDSDDPYPAYLRGYHFDGTSSIMHLPSFSSYTTPNYVIAPQFTFTIWINPEASTGYLLSKHDSSNNYNEIFSVQLASSYPKMTIYLQLVNSKSMTCGNTVALNSWNHIGFKITINGSGNTLVTCYVNGVADSSATDMGFSYFDDITSNIAVTIGAKHVSAGYFSSYFTGFIYEITTDNAANSATSSILTSGCSSGCSVCPSSGTCIPNCPISKYWTGPSATGCTSCASSCATIGCVRTDNKCNLCNDQQCKICTDYTSSACTQCITNASTTSSCACSTGYTWDSTNEVCTACDSSCAACTAVGFMYCSSCASSYYSLNGACHPFCPTGYTAGSGTCTLSHSPAFEVKFYSVGIQAVVTDTSGDSVTVLTGNTMNFYPNYDSYDPYPIQNRGYYFRGQSIMSLPPYTATSTPLFLFGNEFTIAAWVSHSASGVLVSKQDSSSLTSYIKMTIASTPSLAIYLQQAGSVTHTCSNSLSSNWNLIEFTIDLQSNGDLNMLCRINAVADSSAETMGTGFYLDLTSSFKFLIGGQYVSSGTLGNYWTGILYELKFYNEYKSSCTDLTSSCTSGGFTCSKCPASTATCINTCAFNEWWDGSACQTCGCGSVPCVRADVVCNLCYDQQCNKCTDFIANTCTQCITNAGFSGTDCVCNTGYTWDSTTDTCASCEAHCSACNGVNYLDCTACASPYYWFHSICLSSCPTGYTTNNINHYCDVTNDLVLSYNFDTISGTVTDQSSFNIQMRGGSTTGFYPTYDSDDPWATYKRGYYFSATANSYVILSPFTEYNTPQLTLGSDFTIAIWIRPAADGTLIAKQGDSASVPISFVYEIVSSEPKLTVYFINLGATVTVDSSGTTLTLDTWSHISYTLNIQTSVGTEIISYINASPVKTYTESDDYFLDATSNYLFTIGAAWSDQTTRTNFYEGFIYELKIWNNIINTDTDWGITNSLCISNPTSCTYCPSAASICLPECNIGDYYDPTTPSCGTCKASCTTGCLNANYCNLCYDPVCSICTDFSSTSCTTCKTHATSTSGSCVCGNPYFFDTSSETCLVCTAGCQVCTTQIHNSCTQCMSNYYMTLGECLDFCPYGFTADSTNWLCNSGIGQIFAIDFTNKILGSLTDSVSGFKLVTGSSTSFYPTYDSDDPLAADVRGYYFNGASVVNINANSAGNTLTFPSKITFSMWVNPSSDGAIFSKQDQSTVDTSILLAIASGAMSVSITLTSGTTYSVSSSSTLTTSTWWHVAVQITILSDGNTAAAFILNGATDATVNAAVDYFIDNNGAFTIALGAEYVSAGTLGTFFTGFLYTLKIWQNVVTSYSSEMTTSGCSGCSVCLASTSCIVNCAYNEYWDGSACQSCSGCSSNTCVKGTTCNLCYDILCYTCTDYTSTGCTACVTNAQFSSGTGSTCECVAGYIYDSASQSCLQCPSLCSSCTSTVTTGCTTCASGAYMIQTVCMSFCPTGFTAGSGTCNGAVGLVFDAIFVKIQGTITDSVKGISITTGSSSAFYPTYDSDDPYPSQYRGYYFNGVNSVMNFVTNSNNNLQLVFSPKSTIGMWINPSQNSGTIFSKQDSSTATSYLDATINGSGYPVISIYVKGVGSATYTCGNALSTTAWNFFGFTVTISGLNSYIQCTVNSHQDSSQGDLGTGFFEDLQSSYTFTLGAQNTAPSTLGSYYKGFIFEMKVWSTSQSLTSEVWTSCSGCSVCPSTTKSCIVNCPISTYYSSGCLSCSGSCTKGCVRNSDCNLCNDSLCYKCTDFAASTCTQCITNASMNSMGVCQCIGSAFYDTASLSCTACFSNCASCTNKHNGDCSTCNSGYYINPEGKLCTSSCPIGYTASSGTCTANKASSLIVHYKFKKISNSVADLVSGKIAYMGSTSSYLGSFDSNDPYPILYLGLYFTGSSYVKLPPNSADSSSIQLGNTHSIFIWARPLSNTQNLYLFAKEGSGNIKAGLYIDKSTKVLTSKYRIYDDQTSSASTLSATATAISAWDVWHNFAVVVQRIGYATQAVVYVDGTSGTISSIANSFLDDLTSDTFTVGKSVSLTQSFKGYLYEIKIYNYAITPSTPTFACGCTACTSDNDCLTSCTYLQYYSGTCINCDASCTTGCVRNGNCKLNLDSLCGDSTLTGFTAAECTACVNLASGAGSQCSCAEHSTYDSSTDTCVCSTNYMQYLTQCTPCYYHLQASDISAAFTSTYQGILFTMSQAVQTSMPSACTSLFDSSSYNSLGVSPACAWATDMLSLTVTLGVNATVTTGPLVFKAMTLYTNTVICGALPSPVSVSVQSTYTKPNIVPIASLIAPIELYIECNDLSLDATSSSGGYNRPLQYKWTISASPDVPALDGYGSYSYTTEYIAISKANLIASSVNITLTVQNWLGFSASTTTSLSLIYGKGLKLIFDTSIKYVLKTSQSKSINVKAISGCQMSDQLLYEWKLTDSTGSVSESYLWGVQSIASTLFCPANTFAPGTYTFEVSVTDQMNSLTGKTQFSLTYVASDLIVTVSNPLITLKSSDNLSVSPTVTDPDNQQGTLSYSWTCSLNSNDCTSLISSPTSLSLSISGNTLQSGNYYIFTFTASKSTRSTSTAINVNVVSYTPATVTFSSIPKYVNYQENFVIWAYPVMTEDYTCLWTMTSGGTYTLMGSTDSTSIGLLANTLTPGATYEFLFSVTTSTVVSKFKISFTAIQPPSGGSFSVSPGQGTAYSTVFYLDAPSWSSSSSVFPLNYQFGFYNGTSEIPLNVKNESSFLYATLPYITPMTLFVKVYDNYGSYTLVSSTATISLGSSTTTSSLLSTAQSTLSNSYTDSSTLIMLVNSLNSFIISNSSSSASDIQTAASTSLTTISKIMSSLPTIDAQNSQTILNLLKGVTSSETTVLNDANRQTLFSTTTTLLGKIIKYNVKLTTSQIQTCTSTIAQAAGVNSTSVKDNPSVLASTNQVLTDLYVAGANSMSLGQTITSESTYVHATVQMLNPSDLTGYKTTSSSNYYGSFTFPTNASVIIDGVKSMLTIFIVYDNAKDNSAESYSRGVEFKIIEILPSGNITLTLNFSPSYANLTIPYYSTVNKGDTIQCVYYDNNAWSTSGCEYVSYTYPEVSCRCSHTSLFSAGMNLAIVTPNNTNVDAPSKDAWEGTFYYVCSLAGAYVIMAFIFIFIDSKEKKKLSNEKMSAIKLHNKIYKGTTNTELDNLVKPMNRNESIEIESDRPMFYKRSNENINETLPGSPENLGQVSYLNKKKIVPDIIVKSKEKNEELERGNPDYNLIAGSQKAKETSNDTYLKTPSNPLTAYYFISPFFFYMPFYSRLSRSTLLIFSLLLQAFFNGIFIALYESGISSSKDYEFTGIFQDIDYLHIIFAIFSPVFSNLLAIAIGWILIKRRIKIRTDMKEAAKQEKINRILRLAGYLLCLVVIGLVVVAAYWITQKVDGNGDMMWMVMIIISLLCDMALVQIIKVIVAYVQHKRETHL
ncbi:unnamed protein product [Blepharisma stoltei]|uniref:TNFR-Cys domain-containing protein n=1 Tax=Blepharisma stoltei TaxID=1481888 RepID=A0AAU9J1B9_9CILI|nr:unnamed protein product [Blepharisma stoltei]